jgi:hypothetical protein
MTAQPWLRLHHVALIWALLVAVVIVPSPAFGYDGQAQTTNGYDAISQPAFHYDSASVSLVDEKKNGRTEEDRVLSAKSAGFLAAKTATQLEFPFARGASIQTPGVTTAGETFVRVGAGPQNLKFGSSSLSGAQPGTYAFPEATFNAIGQNPAALKNLGDLPGTAPQYFRILQPPAGTPIQRGIVPGGQFGGAGGVPEVIFPKGF